MAASLGIHRLGAVQNEIQDDLLDLRGVALHQRQVFLQLKGCFRIHQLQFVPNQAKRAAYKLVQVAGNALRFGPAGERQQVRNDPPHTRGFRGDLAQVLAEFGFAPWGESAAGHQPFEQDGEVEHSRYWIVDFVRHAGRQLAQRGKAVRLQQLAVGRAQLLRSFHHLAFQRLLHFVQVVNRQLQALAHAVDGVHQFIQFLAAPAHLDWAVKLHFAQGLGSLDYLADWRGHKPPCEENYECRTDDDGDDRQEDCLQRDGAGLLLNRIETERHIQDSQHLGGGHMGVATGIAA